MTYWSRSNKPKPLPRWKPGQKATRNGEPAWINPPERLLQPKAPRDD